MPWIVFMFGISYLSGAQPGIKVTSGRPTILGPTDQSLLRRAARPLLDRLDTCYRRRIARRPQLAATMRVQFDSVRTNRVVKVKVLSTTLKDRALRRCVTREFGQWRLPSNCKGGSSRIVLPVLFRHDPLAGLRGTTPRTPPARKTRPPRRGSP